MLITLEGIDGAGKTTVMEYLKEEWPDAVHTKEPTDSWLGDTVRRSINDESSNPFTDFFLFTADHATHVESVVKPALREDQLVLCDRYIDSRYAYQTVSLKPYLDNPLQWIRGVHEPWTIIPDITILLDIPPETAVERLKNGSMKFENLDFLEEVYRNYQELANSEKRYRIVDSTQKPEKVAEYCIEIIQRGLD